MLKRLLPVIPLCFLAVCAHLALIAHADAGLDEAAAAYESGDFTKAYDEFKPLAEGGNSLAQRELGNMYYDGEGVPQDYAKAADWYRKAAEQGEAKAQFSLALMFCNGEGVPQDFVQAYMWFSLAATQAKLDPQPLWDDPRILIDNAAKRMTPAEIAEAQRLLREWKPKGRD